MTSPLQNVQSSVQNVGGNKFNVERTGTRKRQRERILEQSIEIDRDAFCVALNCGIDGEDGSEKYHTWCMKCQEIQRKEMLFPSKVETVSLTNRPFGSVLADFAVSRKGVISKKNHIKHSFLYPTQTMYCYE